MAVQPGLTMVIVLVIAALQCSHGADEVVTLGAAPESRLMIIRKQMHKAVVNEIAKRDAQKIFEERKVKAKKIETAELVKGGKDAQLKVAAHLVAPEGVAKIKHDIKNNVETLMKQKEKAEDDKAAKEQVAAMVKGAMSKSRATAELVKEEKEGVENVEKAEEMHAAKETLEADVPNPDKITEEKLEEETRKTIESTTKNATDAVLAKVSSPEEKLAIKEAMHGIMTKAVDTAAEQVSENVAKQVVFHHTYAPNGTLVETKMETPEDMKAVKRANDAAAAETEKAKEMEAEKQKLDKQAKADQGDPEKELEDKSDEAKAEEKAEIARQAVRDIQKDEANPKDDTAAKLQVTKTKAKVKIIGREAHKQAEAAHEKMQKGEVARKFEKMMNKKMKQVARQNAKVIKESASKSEEIARLKAEKVRRKAQHMENKAERQAERVERQTKEDAEDENGPAAKAAKQKAEVEAEAANKKVKPMSGTASDKNPLSGPWGRLEANGGIHVHLKVESSQTDPKKRPKMTVETP